MSGITIKTPSDIELLREGGRLTGLILDELETVVKPGNTSLDIDDRAMELIEQHGLEPMILGYHPSFAPRPYPAAVCVSVNEVVVHGIPNENPVTFSSGDVVSIDIVLGYKGVVLDSARTVGAGKLDPKAKELISVTRRALEAGIAAAKPGGRVSDIGKAVESVVPKGFGIIEDFCGHGVGYSVHEEPPVFNFYVPGDSPELVPGMVLAIEPMITAGGIAVKIASDGYTAYTKDGSLSAHMEHTVLIGDRGPEILTKSGK